MLDKLRTAFAGLPDDGQVWLCWAGEPIAKLTMGEIRSAFPVFRRAVTISAVNIRAEARGDSDKIGSLISGVSIAIRGEVGGPGYVRLYGIEGYVLGSALR